MFDAVRQVTCVRCQATHGEAQIGNKTATVSLWGDGASHLIRLCHTHRTDQLSLVLGEQKQPTLWFVQDRMFPCILWTFLPCEIFVACRCWRALLSHWCPPSVPPCSNLDTDKLSGMQGSRPAVFAFHNYALNVRADFGKAAFSSSGESCFRWNYQGLLII